MSIYFNYVKYLNPRQIDKTNKTLLDLQARDVGDQIKLQEEKSNAETHFVKSQVSNARGKYNLALKGRSNNAGLDICCSKTLLYETRGKKYSSITHYRSKEFALAVNVTISRAKVLYILRIEIRRNTKHYVCASIWFLYK